MPFEPFGVGEVPRLVAVFGLREADVWIQAAAALALAHKVFAHHAQARQLSVIEVVARLVLVGVVCLAHVKPEVVVALLPRVQQPVLFVRVVAVRHGDAGAVVGLCRGGREVALTYARWNVRQTQRSRRR